MIPLDVAKRKLLDKVTDGIPPDEGYEIFDGEYDEQNNDENENPNKREYEGGNSNTVPQRDVPSVACIPENESIPENKLALINLELKANLE